MGWRLQPIHSRLARQSLMTEHAATAERLARRGTPRIVSAVRSSALAALMPTPSTRRAPLLPLPMLVLFATLLTTPLWLKTVGLYQYLALEIMIWMLFALGYNLLLGVTGLPSFGHGAYFGIGAYAFGLLELRV